MLRGTEEVLDLLLITFLVIVDADLEREVVLRFPVLAGAELFVVVRLLCNDTGCSGFSVFLFTGILIILLV